MAVGVKSGKIPLYLCKGDQNKYRHTIYPKRGRKTIEIPIVHIKDVLSEFPEIECIKIDIEGAEIDILENFNFKGSNIKKLVFEYSFDIDPYIPRFLKIIDKLDKYFDTVYYTKVKKNEKYYKYFPAATIVYCIKK